MKRDYVDGVNEDIAFFVGKEVEKTKTKGMKTLFVVGLQRTATIVNMLKKIIVNTFTLVQIIHSKH